MVVKKRRPFQHGYNSLTELDGVHKEMMLDTGIVLLGVGESYECSLPLERAFLLIQGDVRFFWEDHTCDAVRRSCFDEEPVVLHVPKEMPVKIVARAPSELCVERSKNEQIFAARLYRKRDVRTDIFGKGILDGASTRSVRTVFDGEIAPYSNMVLGEVINHPGRWSSYPPHDHPQPEIYYYKFFPHQGFGVSLLEDEATIVQEGDISLIEPGHTHSQVAAPGYAMYYIWMIAQLPGNKWLPTTRYYRDKDKWLLEKDVKIWPEKPFKEEVHA
ncbi:MAG: 5-deoxy-glucuronate isomerase [Sphaerochaetaceae bacterium]